jgi:hypothetical protein
MEALQLKMQIEFCLNHSNLTKVKEVLTKSKALNFGEKEIELNPSSDSEG